ncbi:angiogenic factor with G patch and FHA domains 1-like, partial [Tigriopus californicus]|uniref:angiogenic factor with G patch and FHA domains 1-like n=1 Tax=Tigriopus californicus TaxID=6832 RepID=UPI0027DA84E3
MVVVQSEVMTCGELFIVTCMGGSVGREGEHDVLLDDIGCSKSHARITYQDGKFYYQDQGSTNGSVINDRRLKGDETREIGHGSRITIGTTGLVCHVHPGIQTCLELPRESPDQSRKKAMKAIRQKYGINHANTQPPEAKTNGPAQPYQDRAGLRRKT